MTRLMMALGLLSLLMACSSRQRPFHSPFFSGLNQSVNVPGKKNLETFKDERDFSSINILKTPEVQKWIDYFQKKDSKRFQRALNRGFFYEGVIKKALRENGLPSELYFLPVIESSYVSHAQSHAQAVGIWQFIKGTGKRYGLIVNRYVDERRDPLQSTEAAVKYLKDLYTVFHSWELVLAAYNCGEHRVLRAIMKGDSRDYWVLARKKLLPKETRNYVPKFMAAVIVGQGAKTFGLQDPRDLNLKKYPSMRRLRVPSSVSLAKLSQVLNIPLSLIRKMNTHLKAGHTPPGRKPYKVWVPQGAKLSARQYRDLKKSRIIKRHLTSIASRDYHVIKRGDTLTSIGRRYGRRVAHLKRLNGMTSSRLYPGQKLSLVSSVLSRFYQVRKGDNLTRIAGLFGVSIRYIKKKNNLRTSNIYIGQKLKI